MKSAPLLADSGFHSEANMKMLEGKEINGYVADRNMRKRDPSYATADRHGGKIEGIQGTKTGKTVLCPGRFQVQRARKTGARQAVNCI
ncbi:MAG: hypothetical protein IPN90_01780 [Elusimicrobia bacterium]|nr:hypothetical protein [Elusimicrobiota bacterium]